MKFTASIAALILLQGSAIALPRDPSVLAIGNNRLPSPYPNKAPQRGPGSCGKPNCPSPVGPGVPKPSSKSDTEPGTQPGFQPGIQPGFQPGIQPGFQPGIQPGFQPDTQPGFQPDTQTGTQPGFQPGFQPDTQPGFQPGFQPDTQPGFQPGFQPDTQPGTQPGFQPGTQPGFQPDTQTGTQPGTPQPGDNPSKPQPTSGAGGQVPGPEVDDYPYKGQCDFVDENKQTTCQCTSFAAWRVVDRLKADFNSYARQGWGNANQWANVARNAGLVVDNTPAPGAIAQTTEGPYGHVAWVHSVDGNEIEIEDYNGTGGDRRYGRGKRSAGEFQYIHFQ